MRIKMFKQPPPAPTASAVGPSPTVIQIVGRPGTGSLPSTIAPPDHPLVYGNYLQFHCLTSNQSFKQLSRQLVPGCRFQLLVARWEFLFLWHTF